MKRIKQCVSLFDRYALALVLLVSTFIRATFSLTTATARRQFRPTWREQWKPRSRRQRFHHFAVPFSLSYLHATIEHPDNFFSLASVTIPPAFQSAEQQRDRRFRRRKHRRLKRLLSYALVVLTLATAAYRVYNIPWVKSILPHIPRSKLIFATTFGLAILFHGSSTHTPTGTYTLEGTPYVVCVNESPPRYQRKSQHRLVNDAIQSTTRNSSPTTTDEPLMCYPATVPSDTLTSQPHSFHADAHQITLLADLGANAVIVNSREFLETYFPAEQTVRGVDGDKTQARGYGLITFTFEAEDGTRVRVPFPKAVYVPSSPHNLMPPQIWCAAMEELGYINPSFNGTGTNFRMSWTDHMGSTHALKTTAASNRMFYLPATTSHRQFAKFAMHCDIDWSLFAGATLIEDDDSNDPPPTAAAVAPTPSDSTKRPNEIEGYEEDFEPPTKRPRTARFSSSEGDKPQARLFTPADVKEKQHKDELMRYHETMGHVSFDKLQNMARANLIPRPLAYVKPPVCPGCAYGKQHKRPWRHKNQKRKLAPTTSAGQVVSVDQMKSEVPGIVPTFRGFLVLQRYEGATVFVDHYSRFAYVHLQTKLDGEQTVEAKQAFERLAASHGVRVRHYHADNGIFADSMFRQAVQTAHQTMTFCGVNAHHQNGVAERMIKELSEGARTSLLHAMHRWPKAIHPALWPAALKHHCNIHNSLPTTYRPGNGLKGKKKVPASFDGSPLSKFTGTTVEPNLEHFHPFGSPVYVLENSLQQYNTMYDKWKERSRVGIFMCHSPHHATSVPLVLNTQTGHVSPQFHVIYDDNFETVRKDAKFESVWQEKLKLNLAKRDLPTQDILPTVRLGNINAPPIPSGPVDHQVKGMFRTQWTSPPNDPPENNGQVPGTMEGARQTNNPVAQDATATLQGNAPSATGAAEGNKTDHDQASTTETVITATEGGFTPGFKARRRARQQAKRAVRRAASPPSSSTNTPRTSPRTPSATETRSGRTIRRPGRFTDSIQAYLATFCPSVFARRDDIDDTPLLEEAHMAQCTDNLPPHLVSFAANTKDPDTMTLQEALKQDDREEFIKAMKKELEDHINRKHWKVVPLSSIPKNRTPIPMVWSMKRKRNPLGDIIKWKARLCAGGHKQVHGVDYWSTYSPVVSWSTLRIVMNLALVHNWHMEAIDFVLAYPQAPCQSDVYMQLPKVPSDFVIPDVPDPATRATKAYKLIKNLYGLKDGGRTWYLHLKEGLEKRGWIQSEVDDCLFTHGNTILLLYVDDAILISPSKKTIEQRIKSLQETFTLTAEGPLHDYLGVRFDRHADGSITMTQPRLTERVCAMVGLDTRGNLPSASQETTTTTDDEPQQPKRPAHPVVVKGLRVPANPNKILQRHTDGSPRKFNWNYRGVIGCLSYLTAMVRPDITYATQQCARYSHCPKSEHEQAVKRICRYLHATKDLGMTFRPDPSKGLECYVDADWAGNWHEDFTDDPQCANSRTGYVITYAGCPIVWASKMQTLIALSTTEAEYIALSTALREVISLMHLLNELKQRKFPVIHRTPKVTCKVFEDNKSCLEIATNHKSRPRTKHLSVRLHHFRSYVVSGLIDIVHVSTVDQLADIFTKPLSEQPFLHLRNRLMGISPSS